MAKAPFKREDHYSVEEAAEALKIHPESFRRGLRKGLYPLKKVEQPDFQTKRKFFFSIVDVELMAAQRDQILERRAARKAKKHK